MTSSVYFPFLKLKQNEIRAVSDLDSAALKKITPVFDIPRSQDMTGDELIAKINTGLTELNRRWPQESRFYLDVFDINPFLKPSGLHIYQYTLAQLAEFIPFPVVGLDRDSEHIAAAIDYIDNIGASRINRVGVRLLYRDIEFFELIQKDLEALTEPFVARGLHLDLLIDLRNVFGKEIVEIADQVHNFCATLISSKIIGISKIVISSCAIPRIITEATPTGGSCRIARSEKDIFERIKLAHESVLFGDYATISPEYQDVPVEIMNRVSAPKVIYTGDDSYFITRGTLFRTHPARFGQYYELASRIVSQSDFRFKESAGDLYIEDVGNKVGKPGSPSTWVRATINSHLTFIAN